MSDETRIYAIAMVAVDKLTRVHLLTGACVATSLAEATGLAYAEVHRSFPPDTGWSCHLVQAHDTTNMRAKAPGAIEFRND